MFVQCELKRTDRIILAETKIKELHEGQFRKDGVTPYYTHPLAVAGMTYKYLKNIGTISEQEALVIAALSHDLIEDVPGFCLDPYVKFLYRDNKGYESIEEEILKKSVLALTKDSKIPTRHGRDGDSYERIIRAGPGTVIIKICDRLHNISDMDGTEKPGLSLQYQRRYIAETFFLIGCFKDYNYTHAYNKLLERTLWAANRLYDWDEK